MAIHHLRLSVSDLKKAQEFYSYILLGLDFKEVEPRLKQNGEIDRLRFVKKGLVILISEAEIKGRQDRNKVGLHHLAFVVDSRGEVDDFYNDILLKMDTVEIEDPPIECPEYGEGYYATFFFDPDGIKLEVTYTP